MEKIDTDAYDIYKDIEARTNGEIYLGVVGPVRTGKSTFIKRFMELMVIPAITNEPDKERTRDELPQSAAGKTIMTTEPKFIPKEAAKIKISDEVEIKVRLVDCVGYMVNGATGHIEGEKERMVKTPWYDYVIPFTKAAELGTKKVINEHSTIGIVITTDGSFGELSRNQYEEPEEKTIMELKEIGKPFIVLLNTNRPYSSEAIKTAMDMEEKYDCRVIPVNCEQLKKEDINRILENILYEFPVSRLSFYIPKWLEMADNDNYIKREIIEYIKNILPHIRHIKDITVDTFSELCNYIKKIRTEQKNLSNGNADFYIDVDEKYYYETLSNLTGTDISGEYELISTIKELSEMKNGLINISMALNDVKNTGYGVVRPERNEIVLEEPEVIKTGNKFGVKIKAKAPSIHMIKADIMTEIAPIVGDEQQAEDLIKFIGENSEGNEDGIWGTNIFGKSIEQIVNDGISMKIERLNEQTRTKMQDTIHKITNDSKGGVICIIL